MPVRVGNFYAEYVQHATFRDDFLGQLRAKFGTNLAARGLCTCAIKFVRYLKIDFGFKYDVRFGLEFDANTVYGWSIPVLPMYLYLDTCTTVYWYQ